MKKDKELLVNEEIPFTKVMLIDKTINEMKFEDALNLAFERKLDLVCFNEEKRMCKIIDYGKFKFEKKKKQKENKKKTKQIEVKTIRVSPVIGENDLNIKIKHIKTWLEEGKDVRVEMRLRGRMTSKQDIIENIFNKIDENVKDCYSFKNMQKENTYVVMILKG